MRALVVSGSPGLERAFGLASGARVAEALVRRGWSVSTLDAINLVDLPQRLQTVPTPDVVVPVGFGLDSGEDGTVATLARVYGVPCAGPSRLCGLVSTHKHVFDLLVQGLFAPSTGIRPPRGVSLRRDAGTDEVRAELRLLRPPYILKPSTGGSSVGVEVRTDMYEAAQRARELAETHGRILIQELEGDSREITVTLLEREGVPLLLPFIEVLHGGSRFMGMDEKFGADASSRHVVRPDLSATAAARLGLAATRLWNVLEQRGLARLDALVLQDDTVVVLEMNALPGLLDESLTPHSAQECGIGFDELAELFALSALPNRSSSAAGAQ